MKNMCFRSHSQLPCLSVLLLSSNWRLHKTLFVHTLCRMESAGEACVAIWDEVLVLFGGNETLLFIVGE